VRDWSEKGDQEVEGEVYMKKGDAADFCRGGDDFLFFGMRLQPGLPRFRGQRDELQAVPHAKI
jgi:hypothetical protein